MAKRRMFSMTIVGDDVFLDMPLTSQSLYFHLGMHADDDGFVSPKRIMRMIGASSDDLQILIAKRYVLAFDSGVIVIKHWPVNNYIQNDRYIQTTYKHEFSKLTKNEWGAYTEKFVAGKIASEIAQIDEKLIRTDVVKKSQEQNVKLSTKSVNKQGPDTGRKQSVSKMYPQVRLGKVSNKVSKDTFVVLQKQTRLVFDFFIKEFNKDPSKYKLSKQRSLKIKARLKDSGEEALLAAISNVAQSSFHRGDNDRGWQADLDFIIRSYEQVEKLANMNSVTTTTRKDLEKYA